MEGPSLKKEILKGVSCPVCGRAVIKTGRRYTCSSNSEVNGGECWFTVGTVCGYDFDDIEIAGLCIDGSTPVIREFRQPCGAFFSARLGFDKDENGKIKGLRLFRDY